MKTEHQAYDDGYLTGKNWTENYIPGGPFVFSSREYDSVEMKAMAARSSRNHAEWMRGFHDGVAEKNS